MAVHFGTLGFRRDQSSHFCVVSSMAWQFALLLAVRHVSSAYCGMGCTSSDVMVSRYREMIMSKMAADSGLPFC